MSLTIMLHTNEGNAEFLVLGVPFFVNLDETLGKCTYHQTICISMPKFIPSLI
jgi:hypothetical protein